MFRDLDRELLDPGGELAHRGLGRIDLEGQGFGAGVVALHSHCDLVGAYIFSAGGIADGIMCALLQFCAAGVFNGHNWGFDFAVIGVGLGRQLHGALGYVDGLDLVGQRFAAGVVAFKGHLDAVGSGVFHSGWIADGVIAGADGLSVGVLDHHGGLLDLAVKGDGCLIQGDGGNAADGGHTGFGGTAASGAVLASGAVRGTGGRFVQGVGGGIAVTQSVELAPGRNLGDQGRSQSVFKALAAALTLVVSLLAGLGTGGGHLGNTLEGAAVGRNGYCNVEYSAAMIPTADHACFSIDTGIHNAREGVEINRRKDHTHSIGLAAHKGIGGL